MPRRSVWDGVWRFEDLVIIWKGPGYYTLQKPYILSLGSTWRDVRQRWHRAPPGMRLGYHNHLIHGPFSIAATLDRLGYDGNRFAHKVLDNLEMRYGPYFRPRPPPQL